MLLFIFIEVSASDKVVFSDTIKVSVDETIEIYLMANNPEKLLNDSSFIDVITKLQNSLKKINSIPAYDVYYILSENGKEISIKKGEDTENYLIENKEIRLDKLKNECFFTRSNFTMSIKFKELSYFLLTDIQMYINTALEKLTSERRFSYLKEFNFDEFGKSKSNVITTYGKPMDILELNLGVGLNYIKGNALGDINASISFIFQKKGILKTNYYVSINSIFNNNIDKFERYDFLNLGFKYNFSKQRNKDNWLGVELGYIIGREGNYFDKNTFKIGTNWNIHKKITIAPTIYFTDFFKTPYPSVRIGFSF